jgi:hypothetical protein
MMTVAKTILVFIVFIPCPKPDRQGGPVYDQALADARASETLVS